MNTLLQIEGALMTVEPVEELKSRRVDQRFSDLMLVTPCGCAKSRYKLHYITYMSLYVKLVAM